MRNHTKPEGWKNTVDAFFHTLSLCGLGALLLDQDNRVLRVNAAGGTLLQGGGLQAGKELPASLSGLLEPGADPPFCRVKYGLYITRKPVKAQDLPTVPDNMRIIVFRDASVDYRCAILEEVVSRLNEGIVISDEKSCMYYCNSAAARMDSIIAENVLGERVEDVYRMFDGSECPLPRAIRERQPSLSYRQKYATRHGKNVDAIANTWPVLRGSKVLGAFNVLEDWSAISGLHKQIIDLQEKLVSQKQRKRTPSKSALSARYTFSDIIYTSRKMENLIAQCRQVARTDSSVIIYGETGTGKELFAQSIHNASPRADGPFLAINCAALPENLLESLLFGSVKGAYTGAENRAGLFEQADHGTLLLDEINSMNISLQAKLLRVLQEGTVRRVGGTEEKPVDVRVLSCTNVPPQQAVNEGKMRRDLFYRLGVVSINIPPLRDRREDIPILVKYFIDACNAAMSRTVRGIDPSTLNIFQSYSWPGNVRELQHAIEHAINILPDHFDIIAPEYIPQDILSGEDMVVLPDPEAADPDFSGPVYDSLQGRLQNVERDTLIRVLEENKGNISRSARVLQMSRQNLQYRIKRYGIDVTRFK